jgi:hypothetical protein
MYKLEDFPINGYAELGAILEQDKCRNLLDQIFSTREFDCDLFLEEDEFKRNPIMKGTNPTKGGFNLAEKFDLSFIEEHPDFKKAMYEVLGDDYQILLKKFVMGTPESIIPKWVYEFTKGQKVANLGPYIKPEYRDITYFHGIDWHQDIIDYPGHVSDFITVYVYLEEVTEETSPLYVVPKSHLLGATTFPHSIEIKSNNKLIYSNDFGKSSEFDFKMLLGKAGSVNFWHSSVLHGTQPHSESKPRISVRYLMQKKTTLLELANRNANGYHSLQNTRIDLDFKGNHKLKGNNINLI